MERFWNRNSTITPGDLVFAVLIVAAMICGYMACSGHKQFYVPHAPTKISAGLPANHPFFDGRA